MMHAAVPLSPDVQSPRRARRFLHGALGAAGIEPEHAWLVTLLANELVVNAVQHARTDLEVRLLVDNGAVRVEVSDDNPRRPHRTEPPLTATSGRGLGLVAGLAHRWGVEADDDSKMVWFELDWHRRPPDQRGHGASSWPSTVTVPRGGTGPLLSV